MSDYLEPIKKIIKGKLKISKGCDMSEYYIYNEKGDMHLEISAYSVKFKRYSVPLNESEVEDVYTLISAAYLAQESKNKTAALKELKGDK